MTRADAPMPIRMYSLLLLEYATDEGGSEVDAFCWNKNQKCISLNDWNHLCILKITLSLFNYVRGKAPSMRYGPVSNELLHLETWIRNRRGLCLSFRIWISKDPAEAGVIFPLLRWYENNRISSLGFFSEVLVISTISQAD